MRNSRMEKMFRHKRMTTKQRTVSFVVLLAMIFALPMWSMAEDLRGQGNLTTVDIADAGQPGGAFEQVKISVGTVSEGQKATKFSVSMDLDNDSYTEGAATNDEFFKPYDKFLQNGGLTEEQFDLSLEKENYTNYDAYLDAQSNGKLAQTWVECRFKGAQVADRGANGEFFGETGNSSVYFGRWTTANFDGNIVVFKVSLAKHLYNPQYQSAKGNFDMELKTLSAEIESGQPNISYSESENEIDVIWPSDLEAKPDIALMQATPSKGIIQFTKTTDDGKPLPGVEFKLAMYNQQSVTAMAISDAEGKITFTDLEAGKYRIAETATVEGFKKLNGYIDAIVAIDGAGQGNYSFTIAENQTPTNALTGSALLGYALSNEYERGTVRLTKAEQGKDSTLSGAEFEVLKGEDRVAFLTEDGNSGQYLLSDENGADEGVGSALNSYGSPYLSKQGGVFKLLTGDYTIKETKTPTGYVEVRVDGKPNIGTEGTATTSHAITVKADQEIEVTAENIYAGGKITGYKYNDATTPAGLKGATIGIFLPSTNGFTAADTYMGMTATSDDTGMFTFVQIPYGEYLLAEISPPTGYHLNSKKISVEVTYNTTNVTKDKNRENIFITNAAIQNTGGGSGGGGGGGTKPVTPPEPPVIPTNPVTPPIDSVIPTEPPATPPVAPMEPPIAKPSEPTILPGGEVFIPIPPETVRPGETEFEINKDGETIGKITIDKDGNLLFPKLDRGNYELINMDTGDIIEFFIEDEQVPLGGINFLNEELNGNTPKTGVNSYVEYIAMAIMLLSAIGVAVILYRRKQYK